ncbi:hypothetical protein SELMODRAFT_105776 [Selaginella moellendorffii]|uniref:Pentacotripeptide-repeat region of PRORP domain-containing protein n=1 Tax=Selaginella moellendorffii TaxID=88036 RepID=D8S0S3_SELML|nr:hypothetical protein SELMODRAFT_105776 [Selaginella moellendorffii]
MVDARKIFETNPRKSVVSWNALILGYAENGDAKQALDLFSQMESSSLERSCRPNRVTYLAALKACANLASIERGKSTECLEIGRRIHSQLVESGLELHTFVASTLIDTYGKCGSMVDARSVFDRMKTQDVVSWSSMILGYAESGRGDTSLELLERMRDDGGLRPNGVTFVSILAACGHAGLVDQGRQFFREMRDVYGIVPSEEHISCVVDLLCRANRLDEALEMLECQRPRPGFVTLMGALGGCRKWGNARVARAVFDLILGLEIPEEDRAAATLLMASVCGEA